MFILNMFILSFYFYVNFDRQAMTDWLNHWIKCTTN